MMKTRLTSLGDRWRALGYARQAGAILGLAFALRALWALAVPVGPVSDSYLYFQTAQNIAFNGFYGVEPDKPFAYWPVGTAAVYALAFKLFGAGMIGPVLFNLAAGVGLVWTSMALARRWLGRTAALTTGLVLALWPTLVMFTTILASEIFFGLAINLALLAVGGRGSALARYALAGVFLAAAAYLRPIALLLPVVFALREAIVTRRIGAPALGAAAAMAAMAALIAPWSIHATNLHGDFVLISTNGGPNLWMGNNPDSNGGYMPLPDRVKGMSEVERARLLKDEARDYMLSDPLRTVGDTAVKILKTHGRESIAPHWNQEGIEARCGTACMTPLKLLTNAYWWSVLPAALAGLGLYLFRSLRTGSLLDRLQAVTFEPLLLWGYFAALHGLVVSGDRYHMPSIPFIAIFAALGLAWAGRAACAAGRGAAPAESPSTELPPQKA